MAKIILFIFLIPWTANASLWEAMARTGHQMFYERCPELANTGSLASNFIGSGNDCGFEKDPIKALAESGTNASTEIFVAALANERQLNDACAEDFVGTLLKNPPQLSDFAESTSAKLNFMAQLMRDQFRDSDKLYRISRVKKKDEQLEQQINELRDSIQRSRAAFVALEASIRLGDSPELRSLFSNILQDVVNPTVTLGGIGAKDPIPLRIIETKDVQDKLLKVLPELKQRIANDRALLKEGVQTYGASLDRASRESLVQDRDLVESFMHRDPQFKSSLSRVACNADATYGKGAEIRDQTILYGTLALSVASLGAGLTTKIGVAASTVATSARLVAAEGIIPLSATRIIGAVTLAVDGAQVVKEFETACMGHRAISTVRPKTKDLNRCEGFQLKALETDDCLVSTALSILGISTGAFALKGTWREKNIAKKLLLNSIDQDVEVTKKGILTELEKQSIWNFFADSKLSMQEKADQSFKIALHARARTMSAEDAKKFVQTSDEAESIATNRRYNGYLAGDSSVGVFVPEKYQGTIVEYAMKMHEMEHRAQQIGALKNGVLEEDFWTSSQRYFARYRMEEGAMRAEWSYINAIPESTRLKILDELAEDPSISVSAKNLIKQILGNGSLNQDDYLKLQRSNFRYSHANTLIGVNQKKIGAASLAMIPAFIGFCLSRIDRAGNFPSTSLYKEVCANLPVVRSVLKTNR